jgi:cysteinyl-tRNA synthetase
VTELPDRGIDPLAFRYLALTSRYRHKLEYTPESLGAAAAGLESLRSRLRALGAPPDDGPWAAPAVLEAGAAPDRPKGTADNVAGHGAKPGERGFVPDMDRAHAPTAPLSPAGRALHERFVAAVDDDLDLPTGLAVVRETLAAPDVDVDERRWLVLDADIVLGLGLHTTWAQSEPVEEPADVRELVAARSEARARRDFAAADAIRDELAERGWEVVDGADGPEVRPRT